MAELICNPIERYPSGPIVRCDYRGCIAVDLSAERSAEAQKSQQDFAA